MTAMNELPRMQPAAAELVAELEALARHQQAEIDGHLLAGDDLAFSRKKVGSAVVHRAACRTIAKQLDRRSVWNGVLDALRFAAQHDPDADLHEVRAAVEATGVTKMPVLVTVDDLATAPKYRECATCKPKIPAHRRAAPGQVGRLTQGTTHFGVAVKPGSYGLTIDRSKHAEVDKKSSLPGTDRLFAAGHLHESIAARYADAPNFTTYTDEWCAQHQADALRNFDLNMAFFAAIDRQDFEAELSRVLAQEPKFTQVTNLMEIDGIRGVYVMVLDEFKQAYVGISGDMAKRIRQHWSRQRAFDRLIFGTVETSILSIDSFRAFDTTRLYAMKTDSPETAEERIVAAFQPNFLLNRTAGGGKLRGLQAEILTGTVKRRSLVTE
ncbi:GIY-YIG nuclease family protein [Leucobacter sp. cx-169]|uniref:GIY-YIG nuclease family protein n=1 Tax=Leucobacter sp. cx-169 TaxID=2770549 RepID=UPI00165D89A5|nr:GIY-YIG nuclease family protein [Leucobacter sp. cx-169]MBC9927293.1 GIY-YIG nuclease family protein [Leucobacter sp. cx-169]